MKFWKEFIKNFLHGGWAEFLVTTFLISIFTIAIKIDSNNMPSLIYFFADIVKSAALAAFVYFVLSAVVLKISLFVEDKYSYTIKLDIGEKLKAIKEYELLHQFYIHHIGETSKEIDKLLAEKKVDLDPLNIYNEILFCCGYCKDNVYSIDRDIYAWKYLCENIDFDILIQDLENSKLNQNQDSEQKNKIINDILALNIFKREVTEESLKRRRIDFTYKIHNSLIENANLKANKIHRIFILEEEEQDLKVEIKATIAALRRISKENESIDNRFLVGSKFKKELFLLQDIIIFDEEIAFKEQFNDKSEKIIDADQINEYIKVFNKLFLQAND